MSVITFLIIVIIADLKISALLRSICDALQKLIYKGTVIKVHICENSKLCKLSLIPPLCSQGKQKRVEDG